MDVHCLFPRAVYNKYLGKFVEVPCGRCSVCMCERSNRWKTRLEMECKSHKYSLFFTLTYSDECLPRLNPYELEGDSPTWEKSLQDSKDYIDLCQGKVPCACPHDFSSFIKRVRSKLKYYYKDLPDGFLRYFYTIEYGPTTFRPHFHGFLWFEDPRIYKSIKEVVYTSWPSASSFKTVSSFFERNRFKFIGIPACGYVAQYLCCVTQLPPLLYEKPFRSSHHESQSEPIGYVLLSERKIQGLLSGQFDKITMQRASDGKQYSVSPWPSLENRLFPRCTGFHRFSHSDALRFYNTFLAKYSCMGFKSFVSKLAGLWSQPSWFVCQVQRALVRDPSQLSASALFEDVSLKSAVYRLYLQLMRFAFNMSKYKIYSASTIYDYYQRKDYRRLIGQLSSEVEVVNRLPNDCNGLDKLLYIIDPLIINNQRRLPLRVVESYEKQFNVESHPFSLLHSFDDYVRKRSLCNRIVSHSTKVRRKKDYLVHHPEFENLYLSNPLKFVL